MEPYWIEGLGVIDQPEPTLDIPHFQYWEVSPSTPSNGRGCEHHMLVLLTAQS
uniref:Uncharacterized protein n=1 Tax=Pseudomonas fluorescens (strain SBW25) TaxID=216595 RepID=A0A0G4E5Q0_PSEFS|nr:hypothetical protein PQBR57_0344 [Pseudomonas fluorescens SBW25]